MPELHRGAFRFHRKFRSEFSALEPAVKKELAACILAIQMAGGPVAARPPAATLNDSKYPNMKEVRFHTGTEVWRFAFAYDPTREAVVLCGGGKQGRSEKAFYKALIAKADERYGQWLKDVEAAKAKAAEAKAAMAKEGKRNRCRKQVEGDSE